ncbi:unnamed protein product [Arctia plantaginis]|uniref:Sodefrin-like factor n=1 Tax=Arctia plantaginis TaxID=874455 RepID=A0A8S0YVJ0_ARCPL|nr:unnamed protein product [Arctia plantaginis]
MFFKILFFLCFYTTRIALGKFSCYSCSFSATSTDQSCLTIANNTRQVVCPYIYCTIVRQEHVDPAGVVLSFTRGCERAPVHLNHEIVDYNFRTYYRACTSNLCNIGNGIELIAGTNLSPTPKYAGENLLVPGTRNTALNLKIGGIWDRNPGPKAPQPKQYK